MGVHRKQIAAAFKLAKARLWNGRGDYPPPAKEEFICHAIGSNTKQGLAAQKVVQKRLGKRAHGEDRTVVDWLYDFVPEFNGSMDWQSRQLLAQEYRRRWLDALIKEFSA